MNSRQTTDNIEEFSRLKLRQDLGHYGLDPRDWNVVQKDKNSSRPFTQFLIQNLKDREVYFVGIARRVQQRLRWHEIRFDFAMPISA